MKNTFHFLTFWTLMTSTPSPWSDPKTCHYQELLPSIQISLPDHGSLNLLFSLCLLFSLSVISTALFLQLSSHIIFSPIVTMRQISSVTLLPKSSILSVLLSYPVPGKLLILQISSWLPFLPSLTGFFPSATHKAWCCYKFIFSNFMHSSKVPYIYIYSSSESSLSKFSHTPQALSSTTFSACASGMHLSPSSYTYNKRRPSHEISQLPVTATHTCIQMWLCFRLWGHSGRVRRCPF